MRHALRIAAGVVAVGLVAYAVIALSGDSSSPTKTAERKRARGSAEDPQTEVDDDGGGRAERTGKREVPRRGDSKPGASAPLAVPSSGAPGADAVRYEDALDELVLLVEQVEDLAARGEHLSQERFVELYRKGDNLNVALMRTREVAASEDVRKQLSKLNQRFRMTITKVGPVPNAKPEAK